MLNLGVFHFFFSLKEKEVKISLRKELFMQSPLRVQSRLSFRLDDIFIMIFFFFDQSIFIFFPSFQSIVLTCVSSKALEDGLCFLNSFACSVARIKGKVRGWCEISAAKVLGLFMHLKDS